MGHVDFQIRKITKFAKANNRNHIDDIPVLYGNEKSNSVLALLVKGFQLNSILFIYITFKV